MSDPLRGGKPVRNNNFTASNAAPERSTTGSSGVAATTSEGAPQPQGNASRELHHINQGQWTTRSSSSFSSGSASGLDTGSSLSTPDSRSGFVGASTPPERIDPGAVAAFLRAFPSMQRLGLAYSELEAMNPFEFKDAEAFEEALDEALGEKEAGRFKQQFDPGVVLAGFRELKARQFEKEAAAFLPDETKEYSPCPETLDLRPGSSMKLTYNRSGMNAASQPEQSSTHSVGDAQAWSGRAERVDGSDTPDDVSPAPLADTGTVSAEARSFLKIFPQVIGMDHDFSVVQAMDPFGYRFVEAFDEALEKALDKKSYADLTKAYTPKELLHGLRYLKLAQSLRDTEQAGPLATPSAATRYLDRQFPELAGKDEPADAKHLRKRLQRQLGPWWPEVLERMDLSKPVRQALDRLCREAFLKEYPSLQVLRAHMPFGKWGYRAMIQSADREPQVFARKVSQRLEEEEYGSMLQEFGAPRVIQSCIRLLKDRELAKAKGTYTNTVLGGLLMHEIGRRPPQKNDRVRMLAIAGDDRFVRLAVEYNYDIRKLRSYKGPVEDCVAELRKTADWIVLNAIDANLNRVPSLSGVRVIKILDGPNATPDMRSSITNSDEFPKFAFYSELIRVEATYDLLKNVCKEMSKSPDAAEYSTFAFIQDEFPELWRACLGDTIMRVMSAYLTDIYATHDFADRDYRQAVIPSLITLYDGLDIGEALGVLQESVEALWPKIPPALGTDENDGAVVSAARDFAQRTTDAIFQFDADLQAMFPEEEDDMDFFKSWVYTLSYIRFMFEPSLLSSEIYEEVCNFFKV